MAWLEGTHVYLRPIEEDDAEAVVRWRTAAAAWLFEPPPTTASHRAWVRALASRDDRVEYVVVRRADQRPVGTAGLASLSRLHRRAEFGILIGEPAPGAAEDAGRTLLRQAFGPLGLDRVYLQTFADNVRALRLFLRLGFREEGLLRRHAAAGGGRRDVRIMGLLRSEADGLPPTA
ncbi:MAG TPA: GNAT family protein [Planctomycetota bacterium]|nr:GNAT family protein [Planctomycetota bacterium]